MKFNVYFNGQKIGEISDQSTVLNAKIENATVSVNFNPMVKTIGVMISLPHTDCQTNVLEFEALDGDYIATVTIDGYESIGCGWYERGWSIRIPNVNYQYGQQDRTRMREQLIFTKGVRQIVAMTVGGKITERIAVREYRPIWK